MGYMDLTVCCPLKAAKLTHSLTGVDLGVKKFAETNSFTICILFTFRESNIHIKSSRGTCVLFLQNDAGFAKWGPTPDRIKELVVSARPRDHVKYRHSSGNEQEVRWSCVVVVRPPRQAWEAFRRVFKSSTYVVTFYIIPRHGTSTGCLAMNQYKDAILPI